MKPRRSSTSYGFARASKLVQNRVRTASEGRGFAQTRLLTHWAEIVGDDIAKTARPVEVSYGRSGMGATLTLLTTGAMAPMLEMQKEQLRDKVNACYGYSAISRIRITQTASTGFAEGRVAFEAAPTAKQEPKPEHQARAKQAASDVASDNLREALERLGANIIYRENK